MIEMKGRNLKQGVGSFIPQKGCLLIRLDDAANPEWWFEIRIPHRELLAMVGKVHQLTFAPEFVADLHELDAVGRLMGLTPAAGTIGDEATKGG